MVQGPDRVIQYRSGNPISGMSIPKIVVAVATMLPGSPVYDAKPAIANPTISRCLCARTAPIMGSNIC
jgi:hypothetical protein